MEIHDFIHRLPKAEIHVHLEGTIGPETVLELARRHRMLHRLPGEDVASLRRWFVYRDFDHFVRIYLTLQAFLRTADDFATIVYRCGEEMARQNIRYRELTVTTYTHTHLQRDKGLTIDQILEGLRQGQAWARRDFGVEMRWIFDVIRNSPFQDGRYHPEAATVTLEHAFLGREVGVVGLGLGGAEMGAPPEPFAHAFWEAREAGLLSVPHAGETVGPESIWGALHGLGADRIGHGVRAIEDPTLLVYLREQRIPLELCPTSNVRLGVYPSLAHHPFPHLDRMGLWVTVNSDDPPLFNTSLEQEYRVLAEVFGYGPEDLIRIARNGIRASGAEETVKERLLAELAGFQAEISSDLSGGPAQAVDEDPGSQCVPDP